MKNLNVIAEVRRKDFFSTAKKNNPRDTYLARVKLQSIMHKIMSCDPNIRCKDINNTSKISLENGWSEVQELSSYKNGTKCMVRGELWIKNNNLQIRGIIGKPKKNEQSLYYKLQKVKC